jgi:hypothetical protein
METIKNQLGDLWDTLPLKAVTAIETLEKRYENIRSLIKMAVSTGNNFYLERALDDNIEGAVLDPSIIISETKE